MRFATATRGADGRASGIVVLNVPGQRLLDELAQLSGGGAGGDGRGIQLLNCQGYWLLGLRPADDWGFMCDGGPRFQDRYPGAWTRVTAAA